MATTAIVNPRRKRRKVSYTKRRRRPSLQLAEANRRRRHRTRRASPRRRRRNPEMQAFYDNPRRRRHRRVYGRRRNPVGTDLGGLMDDVMNITPAAALGILGTRWAIRLAGDMPKDGKPGIKQIVAIVLFAEFGGKMIGQVFGDTAAHSMAKIAALGYGGDWMVRNYILQDSPWAQSNLYMGDVGADLTQAAEIAALQGVQATSPLGADAGSYVVGPDGALYRVEGLADAEQPAYYPELMADISGVQETSPLGYGDYGDVGADASSSFGYSRRRRYR